MSKLILQVSNKLLQLTVMLRRNTLEHQQQQANDFKVVLNFLLPGYIVHILQEDAVFLFTDGEILFVLVTVNAFIVIYRHTSLAILETGDGIKRLLHVVTNASQGQTERVDRRLQTFQQLYVHQSLNTLFTLFDTQTVTSSAFLFLIFPELAGKDKGRGRIDSKMKHLQLLEYLVVVDGCIEVSKMWTS